jgi:proline iminopeptidase
MKFSSAYSYHNSPLGLVKELILGHMPKTRPEALIFGYTQLLNNWTVMDRLSEITVPTLIVAGRYDFLFPPEHQAILADRLPNADLVLIERAGHNPHMEQQAEVIEAIRRFLTPSSPG